MKKTIWILISLAILFSLTACTSPTTDSVPSNAATSKASTPIESETDIPSPTAKPTPTPEPTMSPEEIAIQERYQALKSYCDEYGDEYAALLLRDMYEAAEITDEQYQSVAMTESFRYVSADMFKDFKRDYERTSKIINGEMEYVTSGEIDEILGMIESFAQQGKALITLFREERREKIITALTLIDEWYGNPTDENREAVEDMYFSEVFQPGESEQIIYWMWSNPNRIKTVTISDRICDIEDYIINVKIQRYGMSMGERHEDKYRQLIKLNNTPFTEKNWCTYPDRPAVLTITELAEISGLSDAALLKYCWEHYGDEYAVVQMAQLYEKGIITDSEFSQDFADAAARIGDIKTEMYENAKAAVNAAETLDDTHLRQALCNRRAYLMKGRITVSLFDTREKRERVINGINIIRVWLQNPTNENKKAFESFMLSDELTTGEFVFLYEYMEYYGQYLPMHINVDEVKVKADRRENFIYYYLDGSTLQSKHKLAKMYKQYTNYERLMVEMDYDM